ncbi:hypothetical protein [Brucella anthropi]|uniref:hypothetical protein n=1 Tax=Brucella anthropi TaxID=529 RepID=UPI001FEE59F2|nr:hypothetical protein [Brucella anthropi]
MTGLKPRHLLLALAPLAIAGCVTADEVYQETCTSFGFRPGTDAFANCMMEQSARHDEDEQRAQDRIYAQEQRDRERKRERAAARNDRSMPGLSSTRTAIQTLIHKGITSAAMASDVRSIIQIIRLTVTTRNLNGIAAYV